MNDADLKTVNKIFEDILGKLIGIDDNIFDHGANSLTAMQIVSQSNKELGKETSLQRFFAAPTKRTIVTS